MAVTREEFIAQLSAGCPEVRSIIEEHLDEFGGEVLLHPLVADLRRFAIENFAAEDEAVLQRCLDEVSAGLSDGDADVKNAIAVSFVADTEWWDPKMSAFVKSWPAALQAEANRQQAESGDGP